MNMRDLLLPLGLALITTWGIQYFFIQRTAKVAHGPQQYAAPQREQVHKPLNYEVDFIDKKIDREPTITTIETNVARFEFSNDGASLERFDIKRNGGGKAPEITSVFPALSTERENKAFLLALGEKTPYYYELTDKKETDSTVELTYRVPFDGGQLQKRFIIAKDTYQLDLEVSVIPRGTPSAPLELRLFYPGPNMPAIASSDVINGLSNSPGAKQKIEKLAPKKVEGNYFVEQNFFGIENKYLVHTLVADEQGFAQRSYFRSGPSKTLFAILETGDVTQERTWRLSFYLGPKDLTAMNAVDPRLEQTLGHYWFMAPIYKLFLYLFKFFYKYLHNYGLVIITITLLMRLFMWPFTPDMEANKKKQREFQRKIEYIQQRYKNDPETLAQERAELLRTHGMPGMGGCLPMLIQLPMFVVLAGLVRNSIELYQAPFVGWIKDLSAPDPYYVLPLLLILGFLLQAAFADKKVRLMLLGFGVVLTAFAFSMSAGLCLYIVVTTILSVAQTKIQRLWKSA